MRRIYSLLLLVLSCQTVSARIRGSFVAEEGAPVVHRQLKGKKDGSTGSKDANPHPMGRGKNDASSSKDEKKGKKNKTKEVQNGKDSDKPDKDAETTEAPTEAPTGVPTDSPDTVTGRTTDSMTEAPAAVPTSPTAAPTPLGSAADTAVATDNLGTMSDTIERELSVVAFKYETESNLEPDAMEYLHVARVTNELMEHMYRTFYDQVEGVEFSFLKIHRYTVLDRTLVKYDVGVHFRREAIVPSRGLVEEVAIQGLAETGDYYDVYLERLKGIPVPGKVFTSTTSFEYISDAFVLEAIQPDDFDTEDENFLARPAVLIVAIITAVLALCLCLCSYWRCHRKGAATEKTKQLDPESRSAPEEDDGREDESDEEQDNAATLQSSSVYHATHTPARKGRIVKNTVHISASGALEKELEEVVDNLEEVSLIDPHEGLEYRIGELHSPASTITQEPPMSTDSSYLIKSVGNESRARPSASTIAALAAPSLEREDDGSRSVNNVDGKPSWVSKRLWSNARSTASVGSGDRKTVQDSVPEARAPPARMEDPISTPMTDNAEPESISAPTESLKVIAKVEDVKPDSEKKETVEKVQETPSSKPWSFTRTAAAWTSSASVSSKPWSVGGESTNIEKQDEEASSGKPAWFSAQLRPVANRTSTDASVSSLRSYSTNLSASGSARYSSTSLPVPVGTAAKARSIWESKTKATQPPSKPSWATPSLRSVASSAATTTDPPPVDTTPPVLTKKDPQAESEVPSQKNPSGAAVTVDPSATGTEDTADPVPVLAKKTIPSEPTATSEKISSPGLPATSESKESTSTATPVSGTSTKKDVATPKVAVPVKKPKKAVVDETPPVAKKPTWMTRKLRPVVKPELPAEPEIAATDVISSPTASDEASESSVEVTLKTEETLPTTLEKNSEKPLPSTPENDEASESSVEVVLTVEKPIVSAPADSAVKEPSATKAVPAPTASDTAKPAWMRKLHQQKSVVSPSPKDVAETTPTLKSPSIETTANKPSWMQKRVPPPAPKDLPTSNATPAFKPPAAETEANKPSWMLKRPKMQDVPNPVAANPTSVEVSTETLEESSKEGQSNGETQQPAWIARMREVNVQRSDSVRASAKAPTTKPATKPAASVPEWMQKFQTMGLEKQD